MKPKVDEMVDDCPAGKTVILAGSGRSGTTWVQEIINYNNLFRTLFEPFHSKKVDSLSHWHYRQYLRSSNNLPEFATPARNIIEGNTTNTWINKFNKNSTSSKQLIKDIRINLCLNWMYHNFKDLPVILLLRHPCAVAYSRLRLGWKTHLQDFLVQDDLVNDFLLPHKKEIEECDDIFNMHIFMWCIENIVPLTQFNRGEIHIVFYENICLETESEIMKIFNYIDEPYSQLALNSSFKPSATSHSRDTSASEGNHVHLWKKHLTGTQINSAKSICDSFGLGKLYGHDDLPIYNNEEIFTLFPY